MLKLSQVSKDSLFLVLLLCCHWFSSLLQTCFISSLCWCWKTVVISCLAISERAVAFKTFKYWEAILKIESDSVWSKLKALVMIPELTPVTCDDHLLQTNQHIWYETPCRTPCTTVFMLRWVRNIETWELWNYSRPGLMYADCGASVCCRSKCVSVSGVNSVHPRDQLSSDLTWHTPSLSLSLYFLVCRNLNNKQKQGFTSEPITNHFHSFVHTQH